MKVNVRNVDIDMELGNNGLQFTVYDNAGDYRGKLRVGRATIEWCKGKTRIGNGKKHTWDELVTWFEEG